jgi:crotonobetainyl-CoA:carnitine CoA-transferase CaiB-like acyl-CoA transferase
MDEGDGELLLAGLRVVDASTFLSGPIAGRALVDLGAEVVKVEPPGGEPYRNFGRQVRGVGVAYVHTTHGKRVVEIDLKDPAGREELARELHRADVLITNWRPGVAESLGLTPESLRATEPQLVWCRISGYGQTGPDATSPAFDSVIQARTGIMFTQGISEPEVVRSYLADKVTGVMAVQGILAAVLRRDRTGDGGVVDVSMLDSLAWFDSFDTLTERTLPDDGGDAVNHQLQSVQPTRTSDGWVVIAPVRGRHIRDMADAVGHPEWITELRALNGAALTDRLFALVGGVTVHESTAYWLQRFADHDVPVGEVLDLDGHIADPQVVHNGTYQLAKHPVLGTVRVARHPARRGD